MANVQPKQVAADLFVSRVSDKTLADAVESYFKAYGKGFALLYSPRAVYLASLESEKEFVASSGKESAPVKMEEKDWQDVFEARLFNKTAELRWLNVADGKGAAVVLSPDTARKPFGQEYNPLTTDVEDQKKELVGAIPQTYLLWGESTEASRNGWTQFAEARIGSYWVPVGGIAKAKRRAQITAIEYLGEYEDGNVAVCEERLTGIEISPIEERDND
jgi:CRISPR-associated protein (TIGR03984 family)